MDSPGSEQSVENNWELYQFTTDNLNFEYGFFYRPPDFNMEFKFI